MAIPQVTLSVVDGSLGLSAGSSDNTQVKIGTSSVGPTNTLTAVSTVSDLVAQFGQGPLVEAAARVLAIAGGPVYVMRVVSDVAGACGTVTPTKTGTATLALSGAAFDAYKLVVTIVQGGATLAAGTATFKYSLDGGINYSDEIAVPTAGVYLIPNTNVTLTWTYSTGTGFVAGDSSAASTTGPGYTTTALATTVTALLTDPRSWFLVHVVGPTVDLAGARALFAAVATHMSTAAAAYRYARCVIEAPDGVTDAAMLANTTGLGDLIDTRVGVGAGYLNVVSPISGRAYRRNVAWEACAWLSAIAPSSDLGEVARGSLTGVVSIARDEQVAPGLDAAGFITARTIPGRPGYYITRGRLKAGPDSDYQLFQNGRVIDIASYAVRDGALKFLNAKVATKPDGTISDRAAASIETYVKGKVDDALTRKGDAVATATQVDRSVNILSTGNLRIKERVLPFGYASAITVELGFSNPSDAAA